MIDYSLDRLGYGASSIQKGPSCIFCIVESLPEVAMDNNDMHEKRRRQREDTLNLACGGGFEGKCNVYNSFRDDEFHILLFLCLFIYFLCQSRTLDTLIEGSS